MWPRRASPSACTTAATTRPRPRWRAPRRRVSAADGARGHARRTCRVARPPPPARSAGAGSGAAAPPRAAGRASCSQRRRRAPRGAQPPPTAPGARRLTQPRVRKNAPFCNPAPRPGREAARLQGREGLCGVAPEAQASAAPAFRTPVPRSAAAIGGSAPRRAARGRALASANRLQPLVLAQTPQARHHPGQGGRPGGPDHRGEAPRHRARARSLPRAGAERSFAALTSNLFSMPPSSRPIQALLEYMEPGDIIIDGGNEWCARAS